MTRVGSQRSSNEANDTKLSNYCSVILIGPTTNHIIHENVGGDVFFDFALFSTHRRS